MSVSNPNDYVVELTPQLVNLATEGGLDTSVVNGRSLQRTVGMLETVDAQGHRKVVVNGRDGASFDNVVENPNLTGWRTVYNTAYMYPISDLNVVLEAFREGANPMVESGDRLIFDDIDHLYSFYTAMVDQTLVSQPDGNAGFSLGVGTALEDLGQTLHLDLASSLRVITWRLMRQLTSQEDLEVGGNSPDGTIGFVVIYSDWDEDGAQDPLEFFPSELDFDNGDPVRVVPV
jgi:hypothetical protein